jgi:hypothetical protein
MSLASRKLIVMSLIAGVFLAGNILFIAQWLADKGVPETAHWIRQEFLTGTAIAVIIALLILLVGPGQSSGRGVTSRRCVVCDHKLLGQGCYCSECGSKV